MAYKVNSLEEMPNALSYLIESVEALQTKVNALQHKQASNSPKWMDIDELCAYLPSHPAKPTLYLFYVRESVWLIPIHKPFAWLDVMEEARRFVESKKIIR